MTKVTMLAGLPLLAFVLAAISMPLMKLLARRYETMALPCAESRHREPTPLLGGAGIIAATLVALALARALPAWILIGTLGLLVVGLIDDAIVLLPRWKFLMQVAAISVMMGFGPPHTGLAPWPLVSEGLAMFWFLSAVNAVNLIDGLDGLAGGIGIIAALASAAAGIVHGDEILTRQGVVIAGALGGFLLYNRHPATIFMGDCGALPLGLLLGAVSLHAGGLSASSRLSRYAVPILILLVPLLDTAIVSVSRLATGRSVSRRGLDHSHHRLLALGLSEQRAVTVCWSIAALAASVAVFLSMMPHAYVVATLPFVAVLFAVLGLFVIDLTFDVRAPGLAYGYLHGLARFILSFGYKRRLAEAALDVLVITAAYFGSFLIRRDFTMDDGLIAVLLLGLPWVVAATFGAFLLAGIYRGIWRYAGFSDVFRFAAGATLAGIFVLAASKLVPIALSGSVVVLFVILLFNMVVASRLSFRVLRKGIALLALPGERVLIVGAGEVAEAAARYMTSGRNQNMRLVGFVDDDSFKLGKVLHGYRVLGTLDDLYKAYAETKFEQILITVESLTQERLGLIWAFASEHHLPVRRFSIRVNDMGLAAETSTVVEAMTSPGGTTAAARPDRSVTPAARLKFKPNR